MVLELLLEMKNRMTRSTLLTETVAATAIAGIADEDGPDDRDQLADPGDQRQHIEERDAEQPQARARMCRR